MPVCNIFQTFNKVWAFKLVTVDHDYPRSFNTHGFMLCFIEIFFKTQTKTSFKKVVLYIYSPVQISVTIF